MEFLTNNTDLLWTLLAMVVVFVGTFIAIPFAQRKGWLSQASIDATQKVLEMAKLVMSNVNLGASLAGKTALILKATNAAVGYVEQTMKLEDNDIKRKNAQDAAIKFLEQEGIEITDELRKLIEVGLESAVNSLPKTNK